MNPERIWAQIYQHTVGRKIVVATNRGDMPLQKTLEQLTGAEIRWIAAKPRRIDALARTLAGGGYDMVFVFTSFFSHKYDGQLSSGARRGGVRYVRAGTGRPTAVMLALAREFGIDVE